MATEGGGGGPDMDIDDVGWQWGDYSGLERFCGIYYNYMMPVL